MKTSQTSTALTVHEPTMGELAKSGELSFTAFNSDVRVVLTLDIVKNTLTTPTRSGKKPSDADCLKFMMLCRARELNPFEGDAYLVGYDSQTGPSFSLITAIQALLKRAEANPDFDGISSGVMVLDENKKIIERKGDFYLNGETIVGSWADVHRKGIKLPFCSRLRLDTRYKDTAIWKKDTAGMIVKNAEADALRMAFPTKLSGLYLRSEMETRGGDPEPMERPQPMAEGLPAPEETQNLPAPREVESEVVADDEPGGPQHWSALLADDIFRTVKMPKGFAHEGKSIHEMAQDGAVPLQEAFEGIPRDSEDPKVQLARNALDAAYHHTIIVMLEKQQMSLSDAEYNLEQAGKLTEGQHIIDVEGARLKEIKDSLRMKPKGKAKTK